MWTNFFTVYSDDFKMATDEFAFSCPVFSSKKNKNKYTDTFGSTAQINIFCKNKEF